MNKVSVSILPFELLSFIERDEKNKNSNYANSNI